MIGAFIRTSMLAVAILLFSWQLLSAQKADLVEIDRIDGLCSIMNWCAFDPDSNQIVLAGCRSKWVVRWEVGDIQYGLSVPDSAAIMNGSLGQFVFSRDSSFAVSQGARGIVWETSEWDDVRYLPNLVGYTNAVITPDNSEIVMLTWFGIKVVDATTNEVVRDIGNQSIYAKRAMDISSDGNRLAVATDSGDVWMYDFHTGERLWSAKRTYPVYNVQFSPDGSMLLLAGLELDGVQPFSEAAEYDAVTGDKVVSFRGHTGSINSARYNRDGTLIVTTSSDSTARVWNTVTGDEIASLDFGEAARWAEFSKGGTRIVVAGGEGGGVWELQALTSVSEPVAGLEIRSELNVHPNPVRESMQIPIILSSASNVRLSIYDDQGKEVKTIASGVFEAGEHILSTNLRDIASGVYWVVLRSTAGNYHKKISVIR